MTKQWSKAVAGAVLFGVLALAGCGGSSGSGAPAKGNQAAPEAPKAQMPKSLVVGFVPSQEASKIATTVKPMTEFLSKKLGMEVSSFTGTKFITVVEGMGSKQVDVGFLNPLGYVLAHDQNKSQVVLKVLRKGSDHYRSQIIVKKEAGYKDLNDLKGKKFAFVDPASTSGYLYPLALFTEKNIDPNTFFSGTKFLTAHDNVAKAVYAGDFDAGACFEDCRDNLIKAGMADAKDKLTVLQYSKDIPNDTVSVRDGLPPELVQKISDALMEFANSDDGKKILKELYDIDGFAVAKDAEFDPIRSVAKAMNIDIAGEMKQAKK